MIKPTPKVLKGTKRPLIMKTQRGKIALTFQDKCRIQINEFLRVQTCMFRFLAFLASHFIDSQSKANAVAH